MSAFDENRLVISNQDNFVGKIFLQNEKTIINFLLEGLRQNFFDYIFSETEETEVFFHGAKRGIYSLLNNLVENYLDHDKLKKEELVKLTRHSGQNKNVSYEELIIDFPVEYSIFDLNCAFHDGLFERLSFNRVQRDEFSKGICLASHMTTFFMFVVFRYEVFQDFTFKRIMRDYREKNVYLIYPKMMKELALSRTKRFGTHFILS